jgi:prepilin-type N-terminal cleavage/methylation domain-containing protein
MTDAAVAGRRVVPYGSKPMSTSRRAFTLIELLVVFSVIALLVALLLPSVQLARRTAMVTICISHLKQYAMGLTNWAADDERGEYPPHYNWAPDLVWATNDFRDDMGDFMARDARIISKTSFLDNYLEVVGGGEGDMFWCTLDRDLRPRPASLVGYRCPPDCDPRYGDIFNRPSGRRHVDMHWVGYARFAAWTSSIADWSHSGNVQPGPVMGPATSQDVILTDIVMSGVPAPPNYIDNHAGDPRDPNTHEENNVAFSDSHVETHRHQFQVGGVGYMWPDHYLRYSTRVLYWLY